MNWWPIVAGGVGIVLAVLAYLAMKRAHERAARAEQRADTAEREADHAKDANAIREDVARLSDNDLQRELRGH